MTILDKYSNVYGFSRSDLAKCFASGANLKTTIDADIYKIDYIHATYNITFTPYQ